MTIESWVAIAVGVCAVSTSLLVGLRFLIKSYLSELKPNSGSSLADAVNRIDQRSLRLEERVDQLFIIISKSQ
jgi:hypothetical protein